MRVLDALPWGVPLDVWLPVSGAILAVAMFAAEGRVDDRKTWTVVLAWVLFGLSCVATAGLALWLVLKW